ncbi:hypothetical protein OHA21_09190 [Actinoplanes sp. NBC_00393]|uniref:hypothetical protein n=1 Tax=Actinoplanes sp. NBC_00393 TaxID=2975953 RepID=UPI002E230703
MPKRIAAMVAATVVMLAAGCGGEDPAASWVAPPPSPAEPAAPDRPERITSACGLLSAATVIDMLGGNEQTKLSSKELPAEKSENGNIWRHCAYGRDGKQPFALSVATMPDRADTVEQTLDAVAKAGEQPERVDGLGAGALTYLEGGGRSVMAVVPYEKELRIVQFTAPAMVPQDKLADTVRQVLTKV